MLLKEREINRQYVVYVCTVCICVCAYVHMCVHMSRWRPKVDAATLPPFQFSEARSPVNAQIVSSA